VRVFGREMGAKFAPMVRQGPQAFIEGLDGVMAMMPAVTDAAVDAGDSAADALKLVGTEITVAWQQTIGDMVAEFEDVFGVSFEEGIYTAIEYVKWFATSAWKHFKAWCKNIWAGAAAVVDDWRGALESIGLMFAGAFNAIGRLAKEFGKQLWKWVKGEGAMDWKAVWQEAVDGYKAVGESEFGKGIAWSVVDDAALARARDAAIEIKKAGIEAAKKLASGGVEADATIAKAANEATKAVKDSAKEAAYVSAGSYAALKIGMNKPATSDKTPEIAATLKQLLTVTRDGWKSMTELEAI
jgi:hypothetical protein